VRTACGKDADFFAVAPLRRRNFDFPGIDTVKDKNNPDALNAFKVGGPQLEVDGQFGEQTRAAVVAFQTYWGMQVDGVVGAETWNILCGPQMGPGPISWYPYDAARASGCTI
jgi:peptidoglycan hydrolase-like protein with peptidoglycan-binding domain